MARKRTVAKKQIRKKPRSQTTAIAKAELGSVRIDRIPIHRLNLAKYNPRIKMRPGDVEYEKLKRSMENFGYVDPLIWNKRTERLVGGHQRLYILIEEFDVSEVDVSVVDLSDADEKALNIALNKIGENRWDQMALTELLTDLQSSEDIDETLTGFTQEEIEMQLRESLTELNEEARQDREAVEIEKTFGVIVECKNQAEQKRVYEELQGRGMEVRVVTI